MEPIPETSEAIEEFGPFETDRDLLEHLRGERWWSAHHLGGDPAYADVDFTMDVPPERTTAEVIAEYRAGVAESDRHIAAARSTEALPVVGVDGVRKTLRWVLAHKTSDVVRHVGHADILREQIDGAAGR